MSGRQEFNMGLHTFFLTMHLKKGQGINLY